MKTVERFELPEMFWFHHSVILCFNTCSKGMVHLVKDDIYIWMERALLLSGGTEGGWWGWVPAWGCAAGFALGRLAQLTPALDTNAPETQRDSETEQGF